LKFQAGTPDVAGPVGLAAAVGFLEAASTDALWKHDQELVRHGLARLRAIPGLRIIGPQRAEDRVPTIARALDQRGVAIRAGDMAALPLLKRFGVTEAARASAYVYSTREDIDRLGDALRQVR
jgi:cysteine desulfurase / selenocysteine lyase